MKAETKLTEKIVKDTCLALQTEGIDLTHANVTKRIGKKGNNAKVFKWIREFKSNSIDSKNENEVDDTVKTNLDTLLEQINTSHQEKIDKITQSYEDKVKILVDELSESEALVYELDEFKKAFVPLIDSLREEIITLRNELDDATSQNAANEAKIQAITDEKQAQENALEVSNQQLSESFDKFTNFTTEYAKIRDQDREQFENQIEILVNNKRSVELRLKLTEEKLTESRILNAESSERNSKLHEKIEHLEATFETTRKENELTFALSHLTDVVKTNKVSILDALQQNHNETVSKINGVGNNLDTASTHHADFASKITLALEDLLQVKENDKDCSAQSK